LLKELRQTRSSLRKVYVYLQQQVAYQQNPEIYKKPRTHAMTVAPMGTMTQTVMQRRRARLDELRSRRGFQVGSLRFPPQPDKK